MKKNLSLLKILLSMFLLITAAYADVPDFLTTMGGVYQDMAKEVVIGLILLVVWIIAGITAFFRSSGTPLKWAVVATIFIVAAPYVATDGMSEWASTTFGA